MKPTIVLLVFLVAACGGGATLPTQPTTPAQPNQTQPNQPPAQIDGGTLFTSGNAVALLPPGVAEYKAAIVFLPGLRDPATMQPLDSRGIITGSSSCSVWCGGDKTQIKSRALQLLGGNVVLVGSTTLEDNPAAYDTLNKALADFATASQHPELANIPLLFVGHSMGGCTAYGYSRVYGARVAGFFTMKGGCHAPGPAGAASSVPGHFLIGNADEMYRRQNITERFEFGRGDGAPWAISIDPYGHSPVLDIDLLFDWIDAVLAARLPLSPGGALREMSLTSGWLGNRTNGAVAPYACFDGNATTASWLPTQETALDWQRMAGGSVVGGC